jgi:hypothetical protein
MYSVASVGISVSVIPGQGAWRQYLTGGQELGSRS